MRKVPSINAFEVVILEKPKQICVEKKFTLKMRIKNNLSGERLRLSIKGIRSKMANVLLTGSNEIDIGVLEGLSHYDFTMDFFPIAPGVQSISGLLVSEKISGASLELDNFAIICVAPAA